MGTNGRTAIDAATVAGSVVVSAFVAGISELLLDSWWLRVVAGSMGSQRGVEAADRAMTLVLMSVAVNPGSVAEMLGERWGLKALRGRDAF